MTTKVNVKNMDDDSMHTLYYTDDGDICKIIDKISQNWFIPNNKPKVEEQDEDNQI